MSFSMEENKKIFKDFVTANIKRDGIDKLLEWLEQSDFYEAPASTRFHLCEAGGLCLHSIHGYKRLVQQYVLLSKCKYDDIPAEMKETIAIVALFHDVCKVNFYGVSYRNAKNEAGVWEKVPFYTADEKFCFGGHGSKSVFLLTKYIQLTDEEAVAINCHMGPYDRAPGDYSLGAAFEHFPLALMLHVADMYASNIDECNTAENK